MSDKKEKKTNAVALDRLGAKARQEKLTPEQRRDFAKNAIRARWAKAKKKRKLRVTPDGPLSFFVLDDVATDG
jgi:hypothetical protein